MQPGPWAQGAAGRHTATAAEPVARGTGLWVSGSEAGDKVEQCAAVRQHDVGLTSCAHGTAMATETPPNAAHLWNMRASSATPCAACAACAAVRGPACAHCAHSASARGETGQTSGVSARRWSRPGARLRLLRFGAEKQMQLKKRGRRPDSPPRPAPPPPGPRPPGEVRPMHADATSRD